jgi:hypothetical protein
VEKMKLYILIIITILSISSCSDYIDDAFQNPNAPTVVKPEEVLPSVIANIARGYQFDSRFLGRYVQNWALTTPGVTWDRMGYDPNSDNGGEKWRSHYWTSGLNVLTMIKQGEEEGKIEFAGAGNAIMAHGWLTLTDYHGDAILDDAFNTSLLIFKYNSQEEIYKKVLELADLSISQLDQAIAKGSPSPEFVLGDQWMNKGDLLKWKKYAQGIKAKVFHRYSLKSTYKPAEVIKAVDAALSSANDDILINFENNARSTASANFFGPVRQNMQAYRPSDLIIRYMDGTVLGPTVIDPRMAFIFKPSTDGKFRGIKNILGEATSVPAAQKTNNFFGFPVTSAPVGGIDTASRTFFKNTAPYPIMTYAELQFIKAEAAFKAGDLPLAHEAYKKGIQGSFDMFSKHFTGYTNFIPGATASYIDKVAGLPSSLTLSKIMIQKYIALWGWGFEETWVDLRRFKYSPDIYPKWEFPASIYPDNLGKPVQRVRPRFNSEYLWNLEALKKVGGDKADYHTYEMWFSQN